jgi:hypothetical protein
MKNQLIVAIATVLVTAFGMQTYMVFQLNNRLDRLIQANDQLGNAQIKIQKLPNSNATKSFQDDVFF